MYEYDNQSNNSNGSASGTGESAGTGSEYRYSGPFYQDNISSDSSSASSGSSSSSGGYSYSGGSWKDIDTDGSSLTLQNIVNAETEDAVEAGDSLAVAFGKIKKMLESHSLKFGQVLIGQESIELNGNDTLFIVDGNSLESNFNGASYSNMVFSAAAPADAENWGQFSNDSIIDGKLSVSEQADSDTDFFAKITQ